MPSGGEQSTLVSHKAHEEKAGHEDERGPVLGRRGLSSRRIEGGGERGPNGTGTGQSPPATSDRQPHLFQRRRRHDGGVA